MSKGFGRGGRFQLVGGGVVFGSLVVRRDVRGTETFIGRCVRGGAERPEIDAVEFARRYLGFGADAKQAEVLLAKGPRTIVNTTRAWGKSTVAAVKALHWAWRRPGQTVALVSANRRESATLMRLTAEMGRRLGMRTSGLGAAMCVASIRGSRILGMAGSHRPLPKADLTIVDDAARVADRDMDALRPVVGMARGKLLLLSSPARHDGYSSTSGRRRRATDG